MSRPLWGIWDKSNGAGQMIRRWSKPPASEAANPKSFDDFELRLGDVMRGERATMAKSLLDVQRELKIKATYIAAIENADPSAFETPGFVAGYVRSYARYLGMDPEWAYQRFCEEGNFAVAHGMSPEASGRAKSERAEARTRKSGEEALADPNAIFVPRTQALLSRIEPGALGSVAVLVALIAGLGYGGWSVLQEIQRVQIAPIEAAPGVAAVVDPLGDGAALLGEDVQTAGVTPPSADALDRLYRPQTLDVPVMVARDGPIATLDPNSVGSYGSETAGERLLARALPTPAAPDALPGAAPRVQVLGEGAPEVAILAVNPAWVRVSAADGTVLFEKILDAGERYVLPATEEPPTLRSGNAGSVFFALNGQTYGPAGPGASVVKGVELSRESLSETYALADPASNDALAAAIAVAEAGALTGAGN